MAINIDRTQETVEELLLLEQDVNVAPVTPKQLNASLVFRRTAAVVVGLAVVSMVVAFTARSASVIPHASEDTVVLAEEVLVCSRSHQHACPKEFEDGGYHCQDHGGCRSAWMGPFPNSDCAMQCMLQLRDTTVYCGGHRADSCAECPVIGYEWRGQTWCNGECGWDSCHNSCVKKEMAAPGIECDLREPFGLAADV